MRFIRTDLFTGYIRCGQQEPSTKSESNEQEQSTPHLCSRCL